MSDTMSEIAAEVERLRTSGRSAEAVQTVCRHLDANAHDQEFLQLAARAIGTAAAVDRLEQPDWSAAVVQSAIRLLARQDACADRTPVLAHSVAASSITPGSQVALAAALTPTLAAMIAKQDLNANAVVTLLTVREHLGKGLSQRTTTALHREWLPRFTWTNLSLPYNTMFTRDSCRRNVADLQMFLADAAYVDGNLNWRHRLMFSWILHRDLPLPGDADCMSGIDGGDGPDARPRAALAMCLRHSSAPRAQTILNRWADCDPNVRAAVDSSTARRSGLDASRRRGSAGLGAALVERRWWQGVQFVKGKIAAKLPVRFAQRRPRVAICISGQLRGYRQAWSTWQRNLLDGIDATIFVHTWSRVGSSDPSPLRASLPFKGMAFREAWRRIGTRESLSRMRERYPSIFCALRNGSMVSREQLAALYGTSLVHVDDDSLDPFRLWSNQEKMHHKIEECHRLFEKNGDQFDLVVRIRPDLPIRRRVFDWRHLSDRCAASPVIFTERGYGQQYGHLMIGDQFAVGNPRSMALYCSAWSAAPPLFAAGGLSVSVPFVGHATLAEVCWLSGLDVRRVPMQFGSLLDMEPLCAEVVRQAIESDAAGRMDDIDRCLIEATCLP